MHAFPYYNMHVQPYIYRICMKKTDAFLTSVFYIVIIDK